MPNRILKDSICTSPNIDNLSRDAEVFFYRLIVQCDDFGRMDARPPILRARCYPLQIDKVAVENISAWLLELANSDLITIYTVGNQPYIQMRTWERHQQVRAKRSKYPEMISIDINCDQVITNVPVIQSNTNPIQTNAAACAVPAEPVISPPLPLADQFHTLLAELKTSNNKQAKLHEIYVLCFGGSDVPEFGYLGKVATQVGGAGRLAELFWQYSAKPPTGDVLAYIVKSHKQGNGNGVNGTVDTYVSPRTKMKDLTNG